jgi:hypothetical protein
MMTSPKQVRTQTQSREDKKLGEILIDHCGFEGESFGRVDEEIVFVFGSEVSVADGRGWGVGCFVDGKVVELGGVSFVKLCVSWRNG